MILYCFIFLQYMHQVKKSCRFFNKAISLVVYTTRKRFIECIITQFLKQRQKKDSVGDSVE